MLAGFIGQFTAALGIRKVQERVRPNPYAPTLPDQGSVAASQGLRPNVSGLSGSEADYYSDAQGRSTVGYLAIAQDVTAVPLPPSWTTPGDPRADHRDDPTVTADFYTGPVRQSGPPWGVSQRGSPRVIPSTLNVPGARTPTARELVAGRTSVPQASHDALDYAWED